jgi:hypothetical protein
VPIEPPVSCRESPAVHFHTALPSMLGPALLGHQVVEVGQPYTKRLLASIRRMQALHQAALAVHGVMGLIQ